MNTENQEITTDVKIATDSSMNTGMDTDSTMDTDLRMELRQQCDQLLERVEAMLACLHKGSVPSEYPSSPLVKP